MKRRFVRVDCASNSRPLGFRARLRRRRRRQFRDATSGQLTLRKFSVDVETFFPCFGFSVGDDDTEMGTSKQFTENVFSFLSLSFSPFLSHSLSLFLSPFIKKHLFTHFLTLTQTHLFMKVGYLHDLRRFELFLPLFLSSSLPLSFSLKHSPTTTPLPLHKHTLSSTHSNLFSNTYTTHAHCLPILLTFHQINPFQD